MRNLKNTLLALTAILAIASCSRDEDPVAPPNPVNEEELITTVMLVLTPINGGNIVTLKYKDLDGDGPGQPDITPSAVFAQNKTYNGEIFVLNESVTPVKNISNEILAEAADHQFFYQTLGTLPMFTYTPIAIAPDNYDTNGRPLGFRTVFTTTTAVPQGANATMKITLKHQGDKTKPNVANNDLSNATGATDFEVTFSGLTVQ